MNKHKLEAIIKTYLRAAAAAAAALYLADPNQPAKNYLVAGLAAVAGPVLKALDSKSPEFGRGAK
jgi:hypothetical protein